MYGVETGYSDYEGVWREASVDALVAVLGALGCSTDGSESAAADRVRTRRIEMWSRVVPPVIASRTGEASTLEIRLPASRVHGRVRFALRLESGGTRWFASRLEDLTFAAARSVDGRSYAALKVRLPDLPPGSHRLFTHALGRRFETRVIVAPHPVAEGVRRTWGCFAPLYSLRSESDWGTGSFGDLDRFASWAASAGGSSVATLPLLATFLDEPFDPGPYVPVSRRFLNELFVDLPRAPELHLSRAARELMVSSDVEGAIRELREGDLVDYRRAAALRHRVLRAIAAAFFDSEASRQSDYLGWLSRCPDVGDYARFRGACARFGEGWRNWPAGPRDGTLGAGDWDEAIAQLHLYGQWLATRQLSEASDGMAGQSVGLQLDLPLGTHPDGYDVWRSRQLFADGVSVGSPPDSFFESGQDWGFPPELPAATRTDQYAYWSSCLRFQMAPAHMLRVDHIMGLHRTFWIPNGMPATEGVYVKGFPDERYAILCLEAHRSGCALVGEDLGTVPDGVRSAMASNAVRRMYVFNFSMPDESLRELEVVPASAVASVGTHDMYPFASVWRGDDITDRVALGRLAEDRAEIERAERRRALSHLAHLLRDRGLLTGEETESQMYLALLGYLSATDASEVSISLDDLLGETEPQNVPGTTLERPNWRRRTRRSLEELEADAELIERLRVIFVQRRAV